MFLKTVRLAFRSAAWRISIWAIVAYALGTLVVFFFLDSFVAGDIHRRSDAWLSGEVGVLGDVAERTPKDALYDRVVSEVAELAGHEVPNRQNDSTNINDLVFFLQVLPDGTPGIWVGSGDRDVYFKAIRRARSTTDKPMDVAVPGTRIPYRVAEDQTNDGGAIYLGLSERDERRVLRMLRLRFTALWASLVLLGFAIVFYTTRRMLGRVRDIAQAASRIGHSELDARVPVGNPRDEIGELARTLNGMLDRIESSVRQLHTITDSLAHDLRSPITAIRGQLEASLTAEPETEQSEAIVSAIDRLDRLTEFLNTSLDLAEARADALRLNKTSIDLEKLLHTMIGLYEPSLAEKGIYIALTSEGPVFLMADTALMHRMVANLLDNELKHLPAGANVKVELKVEKDTALLNLSDDGPGFETAILPHLFERRIKGRESNGHGLGLAFVDAVARAHGGTVSGENHPNGGAHIRICLPIEAPAQA